MNTFRYNTGVIKVGTEVIVDGKTDLLKQEVIAGIVDGIAAIRDQVRNIIVVTSGAVAVGRTEMRGAEDFVPPDESKLENGELIQLKRLYASVGQPHLHDAYAEELRRHGLRAPQVLLTHPDEIRNLFSDAFKVRSLVPVVNENDTIAGIQFFSDNDDLAQHVAENVRADFTVFLTSVDGVMRVKDDPSTVIDVVEPGSEDWKNYVKQDDKSKKGKGGMYSKCERAQTLARQGIWAHIANGREKDIVQKVLGDQRIGTRFLASAKS